MEIFEGVKASQALINRVLSNPNFTFGFEAEFFVEAVGSKLRPVLMKDVIEHPYGIGKKLATLRWADVLSYFEFAGKLERDTNYEVIRKNLRAAYVSLIRGRNEDHTMMGIPAETPITMFKELRKVYAPHQLLTLLQAYPKNGFVGLNEEQEDDLRKMIFFRDIKEITPYKKLNDLVYFIGLDENDIDINFMDDLGIRELAYTYLSESFSEIVGEPVNHTIVDIGDLEGKALTKGYTEWGLIPDQSLFHESEERIGAEIISPVKQIRKGIESMIEVIGHMKMPRGPLKRIKFVTTPETGLHINLGIKGADIDYVKLLMLLGDEYIAKKFERHESEIAQPVIKALRQKEELHSVRDALIQVAKQLKTDQQDINVVHKFLEANIPKTKYLSINLGKLESEGYIEFRSIGNRNYHTKMADILQAVHRMAVIMQIAIDPHLYRKEFLTKLYKFIMEMAAKQNQHIPRRQREKPLVASVGSIAHGTRGGYGVEAQPYITSPYDGETWVDEYGVDFGSDTQ